jgi:hypothetical protein
LAYGHQGRDVAVRRIVAVMTEFGPISAREIAAHAGMAYSTTTPKLRALAATGRAERIIEGGNTRWRMTPSASDDACAARTELTPNQASEPTPTTTNPAPATVAGHLADSARTAREQATPAGARHDPPDVVATSDRDRGSTTATEHLDAPADTALDRAGPSPAHGAYANARESVTAEPIHAAAPHHAGGSGHGPSDDGSDRDPPVESGTTAGDGPTARPRRPKGTLPRLALAIMRANPDTSYKVAQMAKLIDATAGATVNALNKLAADGTALMTVETPATFKAV